MTNHELHRQADAVLLGIDDARADHNCIGDPTWLGGHLRAIFPAERYSTNFCSVDHIAVSRLVIGMPIGVDGSRNYIRKTIWAKVARSRSQYHVQIFSAPELV